MTSLNEELNCTIRSSQFYMYTSADKLNVAVKPHETGM